MAHLKVYVTFEIERSSNYMAQSPLEKSGSQAKGTKFWGLYIDNYMNWKQHIDQILPKLSAVYFVITNC